MGWSKGREECRTGSEGSREGLGEDDGGPGGRSAVGRRVTNEVIRACVGGDVDLVQEGREDREEWKCLVGLEWCRALGP